MVVISNLPPPDHGIRHQQSDTSVLINDRNIGKGTLYITESHLSWVNSTSGLGFSLEYPHISIHAVSRDRQSFPEECLYVLIDTEIGIPGDEEQPMNDNRPNTSREDDDSEEEKEEDGMTEVRFVPEDKSCLDSMYTAMCDCQVLHPDSQDSFSEGDDDNDEIDEGVEDDGDFDDFDNNEGVRRAANGDNGEMDVDEGQFEDAPDD